MISTVFRWLSNPVVGACLAVFSVVAIVASIVLVPRFLAKLPKDYLHRPAQPHAPLLVRALRNLLGVLLVALGIAMLVLPGQGLLTLLVGVMLVDFPGKHQLVVRLLSRPHVLSVVNRLRARHRAEALE